MAGDAAQGVNLEVHRPGTVGDHMVFVDPLGQVNAVHPLGKQVDRRGAERYELRRANAAFQTRLMAVEQHDQFQFLAVAPLHCTTQLRDLNEQKAVGQSKVFL